MTVRPRKAAKIKKKRERKEKEKRPRSTSLPSTRATESELHGLMKTKKRGKIRTTVERGSTDQL